jgi:hypothetical protein
LGPVGQCGRQPARTKLQGPDKGQEVTRVRFSSWGIVSSWGLALPESCNCSGACRYQRSANGIVASEQEARLFLWCTLL